MPYTVHHGYLPGCIGRIAEMHAQYYHPRVGFGVEFEARVASELAAFCMGFDERRDGLWLLVEGNKVHGSIAIDGAQAQDSGAHLRWFITSDEARDSGLGHQLIAGALQFCKSKDYRHIHLWTFEGLDAARHLYQKHGFRLVHQQRGAQWGREVEEQRFEWLG